MNTQDPQWGQPQQPGFPPQGNPQQGYQQPGYPPQPVNPYQQQGYQGQGYPQQPMSRADQERAYYANNVPPHLIKNPWATRSLIYGIIALLIVVVAAFLGQARVGVLALFSIYYAIRGIAHSSKLPGRKGIGMAIAGLIISILAVLVTIGVVILANMS